MLKLNRHSKVDFQRYLSDLSELGFIYIDKEVIEIEILRLKNEVRTLNYLCKDTMITDTGYFLTSLDRKAIYRYLTEFEKCPEHMFRNSKNKGDGPSLDAKRVIEPLLEKGYAEYFLTLYKEYMSKKSIQGSLEGLLQRLQKTTLETYDGKPLYRVSFNIGEEDNFRTYYNDYSIQGIPRTALHGIKAPKGYTLVSGDFKQSDLRIVYNTLLMNESNIPIFANADDSYEALARILMIDAFELDEFKENRESYKEYSLSPIYGATKGKTSIGQKYINLARKFLESCESYQEFVRRINLRLEYNLPLVVTTMFGSEMLIDRVRNPYGDIKVQKRDKALNSPFQAGTSQIVVSVNNSIRDEFEKVGATSENEGIFSYINRHDELIFLVKNEYLKYSYIFQKHQKVVFENWTPLEVDFSYTRTYYREDEEIENFAKGFYDQSYKPQINPRYVKENVMIPIKDILAITLGTYQIPNTNEHIVSMYDHINKRCSYELFKNFNPTEILQTILGKISLGAGNLRKRDISDVMVNTLLVGQETTEYANMLVKFRRSYSPSLLIDSNTLAEYMVSRYCKKYNIEFTTSDLLTEKYNWCSKISSSGDVFGDE
jgi:hypothetical protein